MSRSPLCTGSILPAVGSPQAFLSYRTRLRDEVAPLVEALTLAGVRVWRDEARVDDGSSITSEVIEGLSTSHALLAYYSPDYPRSRICQWEQAAAWVAAEAAGPAQERVLLLLPHDVAGSDHVLGLLRDERALRVPAPSAHEDLKRFAEQVALRLARVSDRSLGELLPLAVPPEWKLRARVAPSERFTGRAKDLWNLHALLHRDKLTVITGRTGPSTAQVRGLGGIGKTLLAVEYVARFGAGFPGGIFWIDTANRTPESARVDAAIALGVPADKPEQLRAALLGCGSYLWVADNLPSGLSQAEVEAWCAPTSNGRTLVTTRSKTWGAMGGTLDLDVLEPDEALELLTRRRPTTTEVAAATELCRLVPPVRNLAGVEGMLYRVFHAECETLGAPVASRSAGCRARTICRAARGSGDGDAGGQDRGSDRSPSAGSTADGRRRGNRRHRPAHRRASSDDRKVAGTLSRRRTGGQTGGRPSLGAPARSLSETECARVVAEACRPPQDVGVPVTHWSCSLLGTHVRSLGIDMSDSSVGRILRAAPLQPHRQKMWLNSQDDEFREKRDDVLRVYYEAPADEHIICLDEKTGIQALERRYPDLPMTPGTPVRREFEYIRHGTLALMGAFDVRRGKLFGFVSEDHTAMTFVDLLDAVDICYPRRPRASHLRQPLGARHRRRPRLARGPSPLDATLHTEARILAEPDRVHVRHPRPAGARPRLLRVPRRSYPEALRLHVLAQRHRSALSVVIPAEILGNV
jgi:hypothetical protein